MAARSLLVVFHGGTTALMVWGFRQLHTLPIDEWISKQKGGHYQYLTNQGLLLAIITMSLGLLADLAPFGPIKKLKRSLMLISLPLAVVISSIYWTLLTVLPTLILLPRNDATTGEPTSDDETVVLYRIPIVLDLTLHASPVLSLLIDFFLLERRYSQRSAKATAPLIAILYGMAYSCFVEYCTSFNSHYPYPFLEVPLSGRIAIYTAATMIAFFSFRGLNSIHR